ncbi:MAG: LPXTG cell wall anchor domain-containing protein [Spirosomataceae bacterium]
MFRTIALIGLAMIASGVLMSFKKPKHDDRRLGI